MKHVFVECLKLLDARKQAKLQWLTVFQNRVLGGNI